MMKSVNNGVLAINSGSSSIKFALFQNGETITPLYVGEIDKIGSEETVFSVLFTSQEKKEFPIQASNHTQAGLFLVDWLKEHGSLDSIEAIGHRIVYGMDHTKPEPVTDELLSELNAKSSYDPEHMPDEIQLIEIFRKRYPVLLQVACFDTSFHLQMPAVAKRLPVPRRFQDAGIHRYGFHGLSYSFLMQELERVAGASVAHGRVLLLHLGNGASIAAVKEGTSLDTTMGFTPASGLVMGTRTGDIDPGFAWYLMQSANMGASQFNHLVNHESGLLGISGTTADMRELLKNKDTDSRAKDAIDTFCYQAAKSIGSLAVVLGGVDTVVFSGGIGEGSSEIRRRICANLGFLGITIDDAKNTNGEPIISSDMTPVTVRVMHTNEELMIAQLVSQVITDSFNK